MLRRRIVIVLAILGAAFFFALGWLSQGLVKNESTTSTGADPIPDAGQTEPVLLFDASIDLLDGKRLRLDLPDKPVVNPP